MSKTIPVQTPKKFRMSSPNNFLINLNTSSTIKKQSKFRTINIEETTLPSLRSLDSNSQIEYANFSSFRDINQKKSSIKKIEKIKENSIHYQNNNFIINSHSNQNYLSSALVSNNNGERLKKKHSNTEIKLDYKKLSQYLSLINTKKQINLKTTIKEKNQNNYISSLKYMLAKKGLLKNKINEFQNEISVNKNQLPLESDISSPSSRLYNKFQNSINNNFSNQIILKSKFEIANTSLFSCKINKNDSYLALGCSNGSLRIYNNKKIRTLHSELIYDGNITSVRWDPHPINKNILFTTSNGLLSIYDIETSSIIFQIFENQSIYTSDFNNSNFITAGSNSQINIYDIIYNKPIQTLNSIKNKTIGPSNRIYDVKFLDNDPYMIVSGGWDGILFFWDLRTGNVVNFINGPLICGDAIDFKDYEVLTGSWKGNNQLEIWDRRNLKNNTSLNKINLKDYVCCCKFFKQNNEKIDKIAAGCSNQSILSVFNKESNGFYQQEIYQDEIKNINEVNKETIFSLDFYNKNSGLIYGTNKGNVYDNEILF